MKPTEVTRVSETDDNANKFSRRAFVIAGGCIAGAIALRLHREVAPVEAKQAPRAVKIVEFSADGQRGDTVTLPMVIRTDAEWKLQLSPVAYEITQHAGTETPYTGAYWNLHDKGLYRCICCETALFSSDTKYDSHTGWPSFWEPIAKENIRESVDASLGMERMAVSCKRCDAHLGHVFDDGPRPTGLRYCMKSASLTFTKRAYSIS